MRGHSYDFAGCREEYLHACVLYGFKGLRRVDMLRE
jgi:hypothetical protein